MSRAGLLTCPGWLDTEVEREQYARLAAEDGREDEIRKATATGHSSAGRRVPNWDARQVPEGIYFCRLETEQGKQNLKLIITR